MNKYILNDKQLKDNLHIQVIARLRPDRLKFPKDWIPFSQIDKLIARNLIIDMPIKKVMETFPKFSVDFVNRCKAYINWQLANNWKYISRHK